MANIPSCEIAEKRIIGSIIEGRIKPSELAEQGVEPDRFHHYRQQFEAVVDFSRTIPGTLEDFIDHLRVKGTLDELGTAGFFTEARVDSLQSTLETDIRQLKKTYGERCVMRAAKRLSKNPNDADARKLLEIGLTEGGNQSSPSPSKRKPLVSGVNGFPTDPPPETVLVGNGAIRIGDIAMLNSGAGMGKSVSMGQLAMSWALGLPYFGIRPSRPLRILHYVGEDDESTIGQIREGFLTHSLAITGIQLTAQDLEQLDEMLATQFDRSTIGNSFIAELKNEIEAYRPDMVFINPLLSYIGGDPVKEATPFLRGGIMPVLAANKCAAFIAHHTCKLTRDSWESMDPTYSGIGGSEMANIPRIVLTMMPAGEGMIRLQAGKRTTVGWKDEEGKHRDHAYFRRTDNPTRPAWLPISYEEGETRPDKAASGGKKKITTVQIVDILKKGDRLKASMMDDLMALPCGQTTARDAIKHALALGEIFEYSDKKKPARGGDPRKWLTITPPDDEDQAGGETTRPPNLHPDP